MSNTLPPSVNWFQLVLRSPQPAADLMTAWLLEQGSVGVEYMDQNSPKPPKGLEENQVEIRASFGSLTGSSSELVQRAEQEIERLAKLFPGPWSSSVVLVALDEEDWANSWRQHSHPVRIGRFYIHPGWVEPDPDAPFPVRIDPGMAFGTGLHPSTRMCMKWMDRIMQAQGQVESVIDVGCGSGVLAIGAALAGAGLVMAVDTDVEACRITRENSNFNGVGDEIEVIHGGPEAITGSFSLVLANILSGVLVELRDDLISLVEPDGDLVLSGVLGDEGEMVREAFEAKGMVFVAREDEAEWCSLRMSRG